jgi:hypothetical protein
MVNYGVGQMWEHKKSVFARKRYQGVSNVSQDQNDDQVELLDAPSFRSSSSAFSPSSLNSSSKLPRQSTVAGRSSIQTRPSKEDVTFKAIGGGSDGGQEEQSPHRKGDQEDAGIQLSGRRKVT